MLPAARYEDARRDAKFHVQVELTGQVPATKTPANVELNCKVVTVFRSPSTLKIGDYVTFSVAVTSPDDPPNSLPFGGQIWTNYDQLKTARYMEVFLNGDPPDCEVAMWQSKLIEAATETPQMSL